MCNSRGLGTTQKPGGTIDRAHRSAESATLAHNVSSRDHGKRHVNVILDLDVTKIPTFSRNEFVVEAPPFTFSATCRSPRIQS